MLGLIGQPYDEGSAANRRGCQCACGQWITAITDSDGLMIAMQHHRETPGHAAWIAHEVAAGNLLSRDELLEARREVKARLPQPWGRR